MRCDDSTHKFSRMLQATSEFDWSYVCFHLYACISVSHQDRLEHRKCYHSYVCVCYPFGSLLGVIQMDDTYVSWIGLWKGPSLMTCTSNQMHYAMHNALWTNGSTVLIMILSVGSKQYQYELGENDDTPILSKGMEHVPNIFMAFDKYLFLEVMNILI